MTLNAFILLYLFLFPFIFSPFSIFAGVNNPNLSAIGQIMAGYTDDSASINSKEPTLNLGEAEIVLEASLNPYFKGALTLSGSEDGVGLEEAYTTMVKGLPYGLALKAGKYRMGFGKFNAIHPHTFAFISPPRSLHALLPGGEEGFNEPGLQVSEFLPTWGDWASTISIDLIEGKQFHPNDNRTRLGWLCHWSNNLLLGDLVAMESGFSFATGNDFLSEQSRMYIYGANLKAKFYLPRSSQLNLQGEVILNQGHSIDSSVQNQNSTLGNSAFVYQDQNRYGIVGIADYNFNTQYNCGFLLEQWESDVGGLNSNKAVRFFLGYAVMEESTLFRLSLEHLMPEDSQSINTISLQLLFSMGPHNPHQF